MLDIHALEPHFARAFGDGRILREWFSTLLLYSNAVSLAGPYSDFGAIGGAALDMLADARGVQVASADRDRILAGMRTLPAHPDVRPGLSRLRSEGFRMVTLTNSAPAAFEQQLKNAGLTDLFEARSRSTRSSVSSRRRSRIARSRRNWASTSATYGWSPRTRGYPRRTSGRLPRRFHRASGQGAVSARPEAGHRDTGLPGLCGRHARERLGRVNGPLPGARAMAVYSTNGK